ncbi:MAG: hypothetical protein Q7S65_02170 [Nanoarchaeota archaeon]|nr:hypothetical protein [Nanoarchaeota archaeon]
MAPNPSMSTSVSAVDMLVCSTPSAPEKSIPGGEGCAVLDLLLKTAAWVGDSLVPYRPSPEIEGDIKGPITYALGALYKGAEFFSKW